ncbi:MAG: peptidyl-prolyl cis-trans isomerase [Clostridiaceae bacterium]|nr:peptidyl-prolyl cis-trans isomerase [Eubacteriales bacterium]
MKKVLPVLLAALMVLGLFAGCSLTDDKTNAPADEQTADAVADDTPVVTVGGEVALTWGDLKLEYQNYWSQFYQSNGITLADAGYVDSAVQEIVDYYAESPIIAYQAKQQGFGELTAEQQAALQAKIDEMLQSYDEYYRSLAEEDAEADASIDVEARIRELIVEDASYYTGKDMTYDEYMDWMKQLITEQYLGDLLKEKVLSTVVAEDDYLQTWYDNALISQTSDYDANPAYYLDDRESFELGVEGASPVLYVPQGYARVMDILVAPTGTLPEDYDEKVSRMNDLQAEYGKLSFNDALGGTNDSAARLAEILAEYGTLKTETDAAHSEYVKDAKAAVEAAYAELQGGAAFREVLEKYTVNEKFTENEIFREKGALLNAESNSTWSNAVIEAFKGLAAGGYSAVFEDDDGYHILCYVGDETPGIRPFDEVKEEIRPTVLEDKKDEEWNTLLEAWKADDSVVFDKELIALVSTIAVG